MIQPTASRPQKPANSSLGRLLGEHQRPGQRPRPAQLGRHHPAPAQLTVADRDLVARLEQIELHQLPRAIQRPLIGPPPQKARPDLAHVIVEDRLAAHIAQLPSQLSQPLRRNARIGPQLLLDPGLERIELRRTRRPPVARRLSRAKRTPDRLPVTTGAAMDLLDRQPLHEVHAADLRPLLHTDQLPLLARSSSQAQSPTGRHQPTPRGGSDFNRRRVRSIQAAPTRAKRQSLIHPGATYAAPSMRDREMLEVALEEARSGLGEGGIPIGAAPSPLMARCWAGAGIGASSSRIPHFMARPTRFDAAAAGVPTGTP
jgi:hypothetical protein